MITGHISFPNRASHEIEIKLIFPTSHESVLDIFLPLWRPGRYEAADFVQNISELSAKDESGQTLAINRVSSNQWLVDAPNTQKCHISYRYFANKMDAGNSVVNEEFIYLNFISCMLSSAKFMDSPLELQIDIPDDYKIACDLSIENDLLKANSYHHLADSPLLASASMQILDYEVDGALFEIAIQGHMPLDKGSVIEDLKKFTVDQVKQMGGFPNKKYLFIVHSLDYRHYHGVEHQNSTVLVLGPNNEDNKDKYREDLLGVASHELFHCWNVTRIRPQEMSPYNYRDEINFDTGFVAEGFTTYFGDWFLKTSGVFTLEGYLAELNKLCERHFDNFGRHRVSLIESSERLWIDGYKNIFPSRKVSIYVKGALSSMILDLEIRKATHHKSSLLEIVKEMYAKHTYGKGGYSWDDVKDLFLKHGGDEILQLAKRLVETREPMEDLLQNALHHAGLNLSSAAHKNPFTALTGIKLSENVVSDISELSPLAAQLAIGDKILEVNGMPFNPEAAYDQISEISATRNQKKLVITTNLNDFVPGLNYNISTDPEASLTEIELRNVWLCD